MDDCVDCPEHYGSTDNAVTDKKWDGSASRFTDSEYKMATAACDPAAGSTVKQQCMLPHHEPDGTVNRNGVHAAAGRAGGLKGKSAASVAKAKAHLRSHYAALKEEPPDSITASRVGGSLAEHLAAAHGPHDGSHSHPHAAYGSQGDDAMHEHDHTHDGDAAHDHTHGMTLEGVPMPAGLTSFVADGTIADGVPDFDMLGASWGVRQDGDRWEVLTADGTPWYGSEHDSYAEAVAAIAEQLAESSGRPVLGEKWRAPVMALEGVSTGDGRRIAPGAIGFRACPMPLMLQTETAGGHMGAVLAGTIEQTGKVGNAAVGTGTFDDSEAGRQFRDIIDARGRFGVSIDVAEAEGDFECTERDEYGDCVDGEMVFSLIKIMGLTGTPFPAFADAYIELDQQAQAEPVAASAIPDIVSTPQTWPGTWAPNLIATTTDAMSSININPSVPTVTFTRDPSDDGPAESPLVAAAAPLPLAEWFDDPGFHIGDQRLVRQPNGSMVCPLTVDGRRVFGHLGSWSSCHTGFQQYCIRPPRSRTGYAAFNLRPLMTADGTVVHVGHITMGAGHAALDASADTARAHYDGGPGAVLVADVRVGEDDFGPWFAGCLRPGITDEQVRYFTSLSVSGDWREVWKSKGLDLIGIAGGIVVPGFPVTAMAADGSERIACLPAEGAVRYTEGRAVALVAGAVRQPEPWQRAVTALQDRIDLLEARLGRAERITAPLRADAARRLTDAVVGNGQPG